MIASHLSVPVRLARGVVRSGWLPRWLLPTPSLSGLLHDLAHVRQARSCRAECCPRVTVMTLGGLPRRARIGPDLQIRRFPCGHPRLFRSVRDLTGVPVGCPQEFGEPGSRSSVWLPAWLPAARRPGARRLLHLARTRTLSLEVHPLAVGHPPGSGLGPLGEGGAHHCLNDLRPVGQVC